MYLSSLFLLSENVYGTRPCEWSTQRDSNSLLFECTSVFLLFVWIVLGCFYCRLRYMLGFFHCAFLVSVIQILYLLVLLGILSGLGLCSSLRQVFLGFLSMIIVYILHARVRDGFYSVFEVEVLLRVCGFVVDMTIWQFTFFMRISKSVVVLRCVP